MLSVPLTWHDQVVGVLNVQTEVTRDFSADDVAQLGAIADLLAGIVEKGRQQTEAEARVEALKAIDEARSELIALVTHELRTPLAVVRAYTDLLADEPELVGRESRDVERRETRAAWHKATLEQIERLDRLVDSILASVRVVPDQPATVSPVDLRSLSRRWSPRSGRCSNVTGSRSPRPFGSMRSRTRRAFARSSSTSSKTRSSTRRRIRRSRSTGSSSRGSCGSGSATRARDPRGMARAHLRTVRATRYAHRTRLGHRPVRRQAAWRIDGSAVVV
jgi:hypothetical protein